jgi:WD40 repeat protein
MYNAFISYSHAADGRLAPAVQTALHHLGKPWYRLRAVRVFRDKTSLSATPALWPTIVEVLKQSEWFVLMASPDAARSVWVQQEIAWWIENRDPKRMLILLTAGDLAWDSRKSDFDWTRTDALPPSLAGVFRDEPLYVDFRKHRDAERLTLRDTDFRAGVLDVAAPIHGRAKDELDGEDVRQHKRARRMAWAAVATLVLLVIASSTGAYVAIQQRNVAISRELGVYSASRLESDPELSVLLAMEGLNRARTAEAEEALRRALVTWPVQATIVGASRAAQAARFSPDGSKVITAWQGGAAKICESRTGDCPIELSRHMDLVQDAVFSPDGKRAATASWDNKARVWDAGSGKLLRELPHRQVVTSVRFSPDGTIIATGSGDGTAYVWDADSGHLLGELQPHIPKQQFSFTTNVEFSPDGQTLVTCGGKDISFGADEVARIWSVSERRLLHELRGHSRLATKARFSPDGRTLATISVDETVRIWDPESGGQLMVLEGAGGPLVDVAFHPGGRQLVTTTTSGSLQSWNLDGAPSQPTFRLPDGSATVAAFSPDGSKLLIAGSRAQLLDVATGMPVLELRDVQAQSCCAEFRPDGKTVLTSGSGSTVRVWDIVHPRRTLELHIREGGVTEAGFNSNGRSVLTTGPVLWTLWDAVTGKRLHEIKRAAEAIGAAFDSSGNLVVAERDVDLIRFRDIPGDGTRAVLRGDVKDVELAMLSPDGNRAATSEPSMIRLWNTGTGQELARLHVDGATFRTLAFSPSSRHLMTADTRPAITVWDALTGEKKSEFRDAGLIRNARFSPGGEFVLGVSESNVARILDVERGVLHSELVGHTGWVNDGIFRADLRQVLTAGSDKTARLWDFPTGRLLSTMSPEGTLGVDFAAYSPDSRYVVTSGVAFGAVHIFSGTDGGFIAKLQVIPPGAGFQTVNTAVFSPDSNTILTASNDGKARIFPAEMFFPLDELLAMARARARRSLTNRERYAYLHEGTPDLRPE